MSLVLLLRGVNVGGHRAFRPTELAAQLHDLELVNIGAAGTFVVGGPITPARLRAEVARRLPFHAEIMICPGGDIVRLLQQDFFSGYGERHEIVRFLSVLARRPRSAPALPLTLPPSGAWLLKLLARDGRYLMGLYRRQMKAIGLLGQLDRIFGQPVTTRSWSTVEAIARALGGREGGCVDRRPQREPRE